MKKVLRSKALVAAGFVLLGTLVVVQLAFTLVVINELARQDQERVWDTRLIYACYNYNIHPCDDTGVTKWNDANPTKAITESYLRAN